MKKGLPAILAVAVGSLFVLWRLAESEWDPAALAEIGAAYSQGDTQGSPGYDGQFAYFIALDPTPESLEHKLDVPAYRYQRILYPLLARLTALGNPEWIPWTLLIVNVLAHGVGTWGVTHLLGEHGIYAVAYGLWVGLIAPIGLDLNEPLAYMLVVLGWLARRNGRSYLAGGLLGLAFFAKETTIIFALAFLVHDLLIGKKLKSAMAIVAALGAFLVFQIWLFTQFGQFGVGSGGELSTPFEILPFWGLLRIGQVSMLALGAFLIVFGPTIVFPAVWGIAQGIAQWRDRRLTEHGLVLALHGAAIAFLPSSTFREPLGILRFADGMMLAVLVFASCEDKLRPLRYALFWIALLVWLLIR